MNIFDHEIIDLSNVAFIKPDGEVVYGFHARNAQDFFGYGCWWLSEEEQQIREPRHDLLMKYLTQMDYSSDKSVDFLVDFYRWDKIAPSKRKIILTTRFNMYETYFNYYLDGYILQRRNTLLYDKSKQLFYYENKSNDEYNLAIIKDELNYKKEADEIIRTTPILQRSLFYKKNW